ncbi:hypothetical protein NU08_1919 [Flavobacterium anhuiense]|uniref:Uncharacterized protein n=1 Tax=Flavobacterium anhuiense TaxID=459526 RepID=A0A444VZM0_9FLAO|nr:hypothetical protein [Flavobacterium anhuiense]RYJ39081.1 hypothetical protein NU08_1919 [Flavobacterium anhuiense]
MKKFEKNYLRVFLNIGKKEYSEEEKKNATELLISIANTLCKDSKLKYHISGSGYGISKGDGFIGEKALKNKIDKKGYKNLFGFIVHSSDHRYKSGFSIFSNENVVNRMDMYFSWPYEESKSLERAIEIIILISKYLKIDYAYGYSDDKTLFENGEGRIKSYIFSSVLKVPEQERIWEDKLLQIPKGTIKKLYPINVFNKKQIEGLYNINPEKKMELSDENQIWIFTPTILNNENAKVKMKVID